MTYGQRHAPSLKGKRTKTHLVDVQVATVGLIQLRVVRIQQRRVEPIRARNAIARIVRLYDIRGRAVLALGPQAEVRARLEVAAGGVDSGRVERGELVGGDVLRSGDGVAVVTVDDGVVACAILGEGGCFASVKRVRLQT